MARIPGHGVVASTGGPTTPEAATTEVQEPGVTSPLPGLTPLHFTNWSLPLPGALLTGGLPIPSGGPPGIRRQTAGPWALTPPMQVLSAPQGMLPIHQQRPCQPAAHYQQVVQEMSQPATPYQQVVQQACQPAALYQQAVQQPSQPATPYQQAVQPPRRPVGRGGVAQLPSSSTAPAAGQPTQEHGRQLTRGRGLRGRSASHPRHGRGSAANAPSTTTPGAALPQPGHCARTRHFDPTLLAAKYRSSGWWKDLEHVLKVYYRYNLQAPFMEPEWVQVRELL